MNHTIATVRATLESRIESDEPDEVLAVLKRDDFKPLTKRILEKLPSVDFGASLVSASGQRWRLSHYAGMTHLETLDYVRSGGNTGIHLLMAYAEKSVTIDADWVEEHNPAYFKGRRERNASRRAALGDHAALRSLALALNKHVLPDVPNKSTSPLVGCSTSARKAGSRTTATSGSACVGRVRSSRESLRDLLQACGKTRWSVLLVLVVFVVFLFSGSKANSLFENRSERP